VNESEPPADEIVTIAEAARRVGITEQKLRRLLARPEHAGRTLSRTHRTRTGTRRATVLPEGLIADLRSLLERETNATGTGTQGAEPSEEGAAERAAGVFTGEAPGPLVRALIGQYEARISELTTALEHEREQGRRLVEALTREQSLRALEAPTIAQETRAAANDTGSGPEGAQAGAGEAPGATAAAGVSWLGRLLGRRKEA